MKKLGVWSSTSLVIGNIIGSGIFMLPASLASYGGISLVAWIIAAISALLLALVLKKLAQALPNIKGGPYAFARDGLGEFVAFWVAWGYWISIWCTNAAIAVAFVSYLSVFFPFLSGHFLFSVAVGLSVIWLLTWINMQKITFMGRLQLVTTILKVLPLLLIAIGGLFFINTAHFVPFNRMQDTDFAVLTTAMTLCLFAFLGLESATIPSDNIENPQKTIPKATIVGTSVAILVYILSSTSVMGLVAPEQLQLSNAPFADAAQVIWGKRAHNLVTILALISTFGALNGWILLQGQIPAAAAADGLFPKIFMRENQQGMPAWGLAISSLLASVLLCLNFSKGFVETFKFIMLLATLASLLPYLFSVTSFLLFLVKKNPKNEYTNIFMASLAFLFIIWAIIGSGQEIVYWGFLLLLSGLPVYVFLKVQIK
jgi:basic amino acid/polyamine antiporter, APA family